MFQIPYKKYYIFPIYISLEISGKGEVVLLKGTTLFTDGDQNFKKLKIAIFPDQKTEKEIEMAKKKNTGMLKSHVFKKDKDFYEYDEEKKEITDVKVCILKKGFKGFLDFKNEVYVFDLPIDLEDIERAVSMAKAKNRVTDISGNGYSSEGYSN